MQEFDYLVIGSGIAGLSVALKAPPTSQVCVLTKGKGPEGSSNYAQGGIASAVAPTDSIASHVEDTLVAGAGLCNPHTVQKLAENGPETIRLLIEWGVQFTHQKEKPQEWYPYHLALEGGHSHRRILHANDLTGKEIMRAMLDEAHKAPNIKIYESHHALDLQIEKNQCTGATIFNRKSKKSELFKAKAVFLATGGLGQCFQHTTNPIVSTGDGIAMAYRAGAEVEDMEFVQFHPTSLFDSKGFLISEAVRGHGGILRNHLGEAFMTQVHPRKDLAPRDIVARAIDQQMKDHNLDHVFLDITHLKEKDLKFHFPNIFRKCLKHGINIAKQPIPVVPAAHYFCGGVKVNEHSESSIPGLFAVGETSCTGVHGANRLASNSLLESVVFSILAVKQAEKYLNQERPPSSPNSLKPLQLGNDKWNYKIREVQKILWKKVGIVRSNTSLLEAQKLVENIVTECEDAWLTDKASLNLAHCRNIAMCGKMVIQAAIHRKESRGLHYSLDYPETLESEKQHYAFAKAL